MLQFWGVKGAEHELPVKGLWVWCGRVTFLEPFEYLEKPWEESNLRCRQLATASILLVGLPNVPRAIYMY